MALNTLVEIVIVPVGVALLALLWPMGQSRLRRRRFEKLVYEELLEAAPYGTEGQWHKHLDKEFVHARLIQNAPDASEFILSLPARLTYELNQLCASYVAAGKEPADPAAVADGATGRKDHRYDRGPNHPRRLRWRGGCACQRLLGKLA